MRKKEGDKRADILAAGAKVFAREGFDGARVSSIAQEAGVATGSLYLYFEGKDAVLEALFQDFWEDLRVTIVAASVADPWGSIRLQLGIFFDRLVERRDLAKVYLCDHHRFLARHPAGHESHQACLRAGLDAFVTATGDRDGGHHDLAQAIVFGGVRAALEFALAHPDHPVSGIREQMLDMSMASIRSLGATGRGRP